MTKKDFELIAEVVRGLKDNLFPATHRMLAFRFAERLLEAHPRFDCDHWLAAAGVAE